jgi:hypothetical protein
LDERTIIGAIAEAQRLLREGGPSSSELKSAPLLTDWFHFGPCLAGTVTGHPKIADDAFCTTSVVLAIGKDHAWARTVSRLYRLGAPWPPLQ